MPVSRSLKHDQPPVEGAIPRDPARLGLLNGRDATATAAPLAPQAGVIVDTRLTVIEFLGNTGRYLQLPVGKARLNLRLMLRPGLQHPVLEAVQEALEGAETRRKERLASNMMRGSAG